LALAEAAPWMEWRALLAMGSEDVAAKELKAWTDAASEGFEDEEFAAMLLGLALASEWARASQERAPRVGQAMAALVDMSRQAALAGYGAESGKEAARSAAFLGLHSGNTESECSWKACEYFERLAIEAWSAGGPAEACAAIDACAMASGPSAWEPWEVVVEALASSLAKADGNPFEEDGNPEFEAFSGIVAEMGVRRGARAGAFLAKSVLSWLGVRLEVVQSSDASETSGKCRGALELLGGEGTPAGQGFVEALGLDASGCALMWSAGFHPDPAKAAEDLARKASGCLIEDRLEAALVGKLGPAASAWVEKGQLAAELPAGRAAPRPRI
jgi:hypothetical protein